MSVDSLLIVSPGAFQAFGHQHSYVAGLAGALADAGTEVHVLGWAGPLPLPGAITSHPVARRTEGSSRAAYRRRLGQLGDLAWGGARLVGELGLARAIARTHRALGGPAVLFETFEYVSLAALLTRGALGDAPKGCIFHDTNFNAQHASRVAAVYKTWVRPCVAAILRRVDVAFVHAAGMKQNLLANVDPRGRYADKVRVLPYGAPHPDDVAHTSRYEARERLGLPRDRRIALAFGTLRSDKRLDVVVEGVARCPEWDLVVAGPEGDVTYDRLRRLARDRGLGDRLRSFAGFIPSERHAAFFGACDVVVNLYAASVRHESGTAQLARAFLAPVIVGGPPDLCDYVRTSGSGWVLEQLTAEALAAALDQLERISPAAAADLGRAMRRAAEERCWAEVAARVRTALGAPRTVAGREIAAPRRCAAS